MPNNDAIEPDSKDWTWVLEQRCPDCGFDCRSIEPAATGNAVRELATVYARLLDEPNVAERPDPGTWSALEYGCHVRDVFRLFDERLTSMREQDNPRFANWDQDVTAIADAYASQRPADVARELVAAAEVIADNFDSIRSDEWARPGLRSDGAAFTIDSFARYFLHDPVHHVWDIEQGNIVLTAATS